MLSAALFGGAIFGGILVCLVLGRVAAKRRLRDDPEHAREGATAIETAVFGVMGLFLAFTFSGALQRWDVRRELVVLETNAIGTAWLRIDLLPTAAQPPMRELFRKYLDERVAMYAAMPDVFAAMSARQRAETLQGEIWKAAIADCLTAEGEKARILLLPALNEMFDITTTRNMGLLTHPPAVIYVLLFILLLISAGMVGAATSGSRKLSFGYALGFALVMAITSYVIIDLEYPRAGLIRVI
ncbi:MAG TPA: DUF4239 domain-containing protein, partial [Myxococcota bacterium]|nr:DUF4239 domain-containing protein [Myxococcota bacterium]